MGMHRYKLPGAVRLPEDPLTRRVARGQARCVLALRLERRLSRLFVVKQTGINWKRIRGLEEGAHVACLDELVKLAALFSIRPLTLIREVMAYGEKDVNNKTRKRSSSARTHSGTQRLRRPTGESKK